MCCSRNVRRIVRIRGAPHPLGARRGRSEVVHRFGDVRGRRERDVKSELVKGEAFVDDDHICRESDTPGQTRPRRHPQYCAGRDPTSSEANNLVAVVFAVLSESTRLRRKTM